MKEITAKELADKLDRKEEVTIIDVREEEEVATGMVPGSIHMPLSVFGEQVNKLDKKTPYIFICRSGSRSGMVCRTLEEHGYDVCNVSNGIIAWPGEIE